MRDSMMGTSDEELKLLKSARKSLKEEAEQAQKRLAGLEDELARNGDVYSVESERTRYLALALEDRLRDIDHELKDLRAEINARQLKIGV